MNRILLLMALLAALVAAGRITVNPYGVQGIGKVFTPKVKISL